MNIYIIFENHLHSERIVKGVCSTSEKAWDQIKELESGNKDNSVKYEIENWIVDFKNR